jgi:PAS domain S-box-containing protein
VTSEQKLVGQVTKIERDLGMANRRLLMWTAVCLVVAVVFGWMISRSISGPVRELQGAVTEVGEGRLSTRIPVKRNDELGVLAGAFNQMVSDLSRTTVSKTYVDNIIRSMGDALFVMNGHCRIKMVNEAALALLGYEREELVDSHISLILPEEVARDVSGSSLMRIGFRANVERRLRAKNGKGIPVWRTSCAWRRTSRRSSRRSGRFGRRGTSWRCGCGTGRRSWRRRTGRWSRRWRSAGTWRRRCWRSASGSGGRSVTICTTGWVRA